MALRFRLADAADAGAIAQLVNAAYRPGVDSSSWTHESRLVAGARTSEEQVRLALAHTQILAGYFDGRLASCVQIERRGGDAYLGMLAVAPDRQGAGFGSATLAQAETYAAGLSGVERLVMLVVDARAELIAFYRRRGYVDSGERRPYPVDSGVGVPRGMRLELMVLYKPARGIAPMYPASR